MKKKTRKEQKQSFSTVVKLNQTKQRQSVLMLFLCFSTKSGNHIRADCCTRNNRANCLNQRQIRLTRVISCKRLKRRKALLKTKPSHSLKDTGRTRPIQNRIERQNEKIKKKNKSFLTEQANECFCKYSACLQSSTTTYAEKP